MGSGLRTQSLKLPRPMMINKSLLVVSTAWKKIHICLLLQFQFFFVISLFVLVEFSTIWEFLWFLWFFWHWVFHVLLKKCRDLCASHWSAQFWSVQCGVVTEKNLLLRWDDHFCPPEIKPQSCNKVLYFSVLLLHLRFSFTNRCGSTSKYQLRDALMNVTTHQMLQSTRARCCFAWINLTFSVSLTI
jgi:hypothetical protein